jgi:nitroimidazol reductase NimA-like FMN-containing flavoprotein (pyridoxamine 5'-phosphate oxidase superfamily)
MFGTLSNQEIKQVLSDNIFGRLGFSDRKNTYIIPISYAFHDNIIYCHTREGSKLKIMRSNPSVCFEVEVISDMANWKTVLCMGKFEEIVNKEDRSHALEYLVERLLPIISSETTHLFPNWPFPPSNLNEIKGVVFKINITSATGRFEKYDKVTI